MSWYPLICEAGKAIIMPFRRPTKQYKGKMSWYPHVLYHYWGSTLNLELNLDTAASVQKYLAWSVLEFMVSDLERSGYGFYSISF